MIPLLILGLLIENPGANGYELLTLMNQGHYKYIVSYTKGSFYYNLQQLEDKGYIVRLEETDQIRDSHHYQISEAGKSYFNELMQSYGTKSEYVNLSFYAAFLFEESFPENEMKALIQSQIEQTEEKIRLLDMSLQTNQDLTKTFRKMLENSRAHHEVNLEWFKSLLV